MFEIRLETGTAASLDGRTEDFIFGIVVRGLRVLTDMYRGELLGASHIL